MKINVKSLYILLLLLFPLFWFIFVNETMTHLNEFIGNFFPHSSVGKESACNAEDPSSVPGLGRSTGEGRGYPLQYSWASLVAQLVKNLPVMRETWVWSLGWEDPLEKGKVIHSGNLAWKLYGLYRPWVTKSQTRLSYFRFHFLRSKHTSQHKLLQIEIFYTYIHKLLFIIFLKSYFYHHNPSNFYFIFQIISFF